jgi:hypothetical protein
MMDNSGNYLYRINMMIYRMPGTLPTTVEDHSKIIHGIKDKDPTKIGHKDGRPRKHLNPASKINLETVNYARFQGGIMSKRRLSLILALLVFGFVPGLTSAAAPFYAGETIRIVVGASPGGVMIRGLDWSPGTWASIFRAILLLLWIICLGLEA